MGAFQHIGAPAQRVEAAADLEAVGAGFHEEGVVGGAVGGGPVGEGWEGAVGVAFQLGGLMEGGASEDGPGEGVRVAVDPDTPSFGGRRGGEVGFKACLRVPLPPLRRRQLGLGWFWFGLGWFWFSFLSGFPGVPVKGGGNRCGRLDVQCYGRKVAFRHPGSCAP